jgi:ectoine hydroxylase-related dioxygenase (phytanoyl-CoA dioxygenase family)
MAEVSSAEREAFERDGVVVLRSGLAPQWLELLARGVDHNHDHPSRWAFGFSQAGSLEGFWSDYGTWQGVDEYRRVVFESDLARAAGALMGSRTVRFFHEHVLVKEPGTTQRTPWHHDQPYYCVDGDQNVSMWIPLDPVPEAAGLRFIAGSHRWARWFVPRTFAEHESYTSAGEGFELVPDLDAELDRQRVLQFRLDPGDVLCFHFRTLHDAPGTEAMSGRRRAVSLRWIGDDATFALRPWEHSPPYEQGSLEVGGPLADDRFPLVPT